MGPLLNQRLGCCSFSCSKWGWKDVDFPTILLANVRKEMNVVLCDLSVMWTVTLSTQVLL